MTLKTSLLRQAFGVVSIFILVLAVEPVLADLKDTEVELEETLAESEAAVAEAKEAANREAVEKAESEKADQKAQDSIAKARSKKRDADAEIKKIERQTETYKAERKEKEKLLRAAHAEFLGYEQKIVEHKKKMEKEKIQTEVANEELVKKNEDVAELVDKARGWEEKLRDLQDQKLAVLDSLKKEKLKEKKSQLRLKDAQAAHKAKANLIAKKIDSLKKDVIKLKETTAKNEISIRQIRQEGENREASLRVVEEESEQYRVRAEQAKAQLDLVKSKYRAKKRSQVVRKKRALASKKKYEADIVEAKIEKSSWTETAERDADKTYPAGAKIQTFKKRSKKYRRKIGQDCNMRSIASVSGKVLKKVGKGNKIVTSKYNRNWYRAYLGKKKGFVAKSCF